jgi:hypothetical protein
VSAQVKLARTTVSVPAANNYEIDGNGLLHLSTAGWGTRVAVFQPGWEWVVIEPNRGPNGRFIKKE